MDQGEDEMLSVNPYLNFKGNTEEAFNFYRKVFGGEFRNVIRFREFGGKEMGIPEADLDRIAHIALPLGKDDMLMGTDVLESLGQTLNVGNNSYLNIDAESAEEADRLFRALAEGGSVEMALAQTQWAEKYGICADRYGVQWMINYTGNVGTR